MFNMIKVLLKLQVDELKQVKENISKLNNSESQTSTKFIDTDEVIKSNLPNRGNLLINTERNHKSSMNELTFKYKNELQELEMIFNKTLSRYSYITI